MNNIFNRCLLSILVVFSLLFLQGCDEGVNENDPSVTSSNTDPVDDYTQNAPVEDPLINEYNSNNPAADSSTDELNSSNPVAAPLTDEHGSSNPVTNPLTDEHNSSYNPTAFDTNLGAILLSSLVALIILYLFFEQFAKTILIIIEKVASTIVKIGLIIIKFPWSVLKWCLSLFGL